MNALLALVVFLAIAGVVVLVIEPFKANKENGASSEPLKATSASSARRLATDSVTVVVCEHARNGYRYDKLDPVGVNVTVTAAQFPEDISFCRTLRSLSNEVHEFPSAEPEEDCRAFSSEGRQITSADSLVEGQKYFTFPMDRPFVWPTVKVGHTTVIEYNSEDERTDSVGIRLETISEEPRIFRIHNFVSDEETEALITRAKSLKMERSTGGLQKQDSTQQDNQGDIISDRTSTNTWDTKSPLAMKIKKRALEMMRMEFKDDWTDGLQVVRYEPPQYYNSHEDWFSIGASPNWNWDPTKGGVNRFATVFLYLNDVELGGETVFPKSKTKMEPNTYRQEDFERLSNELMQVNSTPWKLARECRTGFRVAPKRGDAILFYNQGPGGGLDRAALHGACPAIEGVKWGVNLWIWNERTWSPEREPGFYEDDHVAKKSRSGYFYNDLDETIEVYWAENAVDLVGLGTIQPQDKYQSNTFVGHTFVFKAKEVEVGRYTIEQDKEIQKFHIHPDGSYREHSEL